MAYYEATGNSVIYDVIINLGDCLVARFGYGKPIGLPGHPEIELALLRLYELTQEKKYLKLAEYFILERGKDPNFFIEEPKKRIAKGIPSWLDLNNNNGFVNPESDNVEDVSYYVATKPLTEQFVVEGHAVRACYLYSALAELAVLENDQQLKETALRLWDNATTKQMYITGGIGSTNMNEGFTYDYDLPNENNYCETCAGIALIFWAKRMMRFDSDSKYSDIIEKTLYNNTLGSMSLDGTSFYYRNELERWNRNIEKAERPNWHACACCPPNLARLILSLQEYIYHVDEKANIFYVDQFIGSQVQGKFKGQSFSVQQVAGFPWNGDVIYRMEKVPRQPFSFGLRLPSWSDSFSVKLNGKVLREGVDFTLNKGYLLFFYKWQHGDVLNYHMGITSKLVYANPLVKYDAGKAVITRGPIIYCLEEQDNGAQLWQLSVNSDESFTEEWSEELGGIIKVGCGGSRDLAYSKDLYTYIPIQQMLAELTAIPFYARFNRDIGELQVWTRIKS